MAATRPVIFFSGPESGLGNRTDRSIAIEAGGVTDPSFGRDRRDQFTQPLPLNDLPPHRRRIRTGQVTS
jgi:hypothetical protein